MELIEPTITLYHLFHEKKQDYFISFNCYFIVFNYHFIKAIFAQVNSEQE